MKEDYKFYCMLKNEGYKEDSDIIKHFINQNLIERIDIIENLSEVELYFLIDKCIGYFINNGSDRRYKNTLDISTIIINNQVDNVSNWYKLWTKRIQTLSKEEEIYLINRRRNGLNINLKLNSDKFPSNIELYPFNNSHIDFYNNYLTYQELNNKNREKVKIS